MRTKILVGIFIFFCLVGVSSASAATIYVPDEHSTIQQAVNNANDGDTIIVRDGTYPTGNVPVNKQLTIKSENGSTNCIVNFNGWFGDVFQVTADYVNITGFTIRGGPDSGIVLNSVSNCKISNNNILDNGRGIYLIDASNNIISNNNISDNDNGIYLSNSNNNQIYLNNFNNFMGSDDSNVISHSLTNIWNSTEPIKYNYNGQTYTNYLGNHWVGYTFSDNNPEDGIGDTPHNIPGVGYDNHPLMQPFKNYETSSEEAEEDTPESIPEFPTIALPVIGMLAILTIMNRRRQ